MKESSLETILRRWWVQKYKIPWTHELAQSHTLLELCTEWWEDYYEDNPKELRAQFADEDGEIMFSDTGDELIDKWEREAALGLVPDLEEGLPKQIREALKKERTESGRGRKQFSELTSPPLTKENSRYEAGPTSPTAADRTILTKKLLGGNGQADDGWVDQLGGMKNG